MFLFLQMTRSVTNLGWPIMLQCRWRSVDAASTHQICNMSTGECYESSLQLKKRQEHLCQADTVKFCADEQAEVSLEEEIDLRSQEASKSFGSSSASGYFIKDKCSTFSREISSPSSFLSHADRVDMHAVEPSLLPGPEASHSGSADFSHYDNASEETQLEVSLSCIPDHGVEPPLPSLCVIEPLLSSESGQRFELGHLQVGEHMFSSDLFSRDDDPEVNHLVHNTTNGLGFFARPSDAPSSFCPIWNSPSSAKSWSSWLVQRMARLWFGPSGKFYVLRNNLNLLTLKGGVFDPSRRFGKMEREPSSSGTASPSLRVNPRYKGKSPKPFHASAAAAAASKPSRSK
jgi:hypothetical protein